MGLTLISSSGSKFQIQAWDLLPVVGQQLLVKAGSYIIFEVDNLNVYSRVRLWLRVIFCFLEGVSKRACPHYCNKDTTLIKFHLVR